ncbi:MAG: DUF3618 domain-containing protein [Acidobacteriota bacterium]
MDDQTKGVGPERAAGRSDEYVSGREALDNEGRIGERGTSRIPSRGDGDSERMHAPESARNFPPSSTGSSDDATVAARALEIRAEIEQTRGEMSETVNAIQDRLRPSNLAADAAESVKSSVKQVAGEQARMVGDAAREFADSEPVQYVRANPIPAAMVGVGLAGLAWLAFGGRDADDRGYRSGGRTARDWRRMSPYDDADRFYRGGAGRGDGNYGGYASRGMGGRNASFGEAGFGESEYPGQSGYEAGFASDASAGRAWSGAGAEGRSRAAAGTEGRSWTEAGASELSDMGDAAADFGRRAERKGRQATRTVQRAWQQNPLLMGAASAVLGLMVGMAIPETEIENEYMGETRDQALEEVQQTVRDTVGKVQSAATSAVDLIAGGGTASGDKDGSGVSGQASPGGQSGSAGQGPTANRSTGSSQAGSSGQGAGSDQAAGSNTAAKNQEQKDIGSSQPPRKSGV